MIAETQAGVHLKFHIESISGTYAVTAIQPVR
jgi:hypothetical protein